MISLPEEFMIMNKITGLIVILVLAVGLMSCEEEGNVLIDNSGEAQLQVMVDAVAYNMPAGSHIRVQLEPGLHSYSIKDESGEVQEEGSFTVIEGGLLNAAKEEYLIWAEWYGDMSMKETTLKQEWIKVDDIEIFGEFERISGEDTYLEKRWDQNIDEDLPESVMAWELTDKRWVIKRKIFRLEEALIHYQSVSAPSS